MLTLLTFPSWRFSPQVCFAGLQVPVFPPLHLQGVEIEEGEVKEGGHSVCFTGACAEIVRGGRVELPDDISVEGVV